MKTLNEVVDIVGLSRRAIQEYEVAGLAQKPETKNKYGYLLYDTPAIERLWQLRFYKELGYNISKIQSTFNSNTYDAEEELEKVIDSLTEKKKKIENMISIATVMKESGLSFNSLRHGFTEIGELKSDDLFSIMGESFKYFNSQNEEDGYLEILQDADYARLFSGLDRIVDCCKKGMSYDSDKVQRIVTKIHGICKKAISESIIIFKWFLVFLEPGSVFYKELLEDMDEKHIEYARNAFHYYCEVNADNEVDMKMLNAIDNVEKLGRNRYTTNSLEVQGEIKKIHDFYKGLKFLTEDVQFERMEKLGEMFGSQAYKDFIDNGHERGLSWFMARAIEIYCNNYKKQEIT